MDSLLYPQFPRDNVRKISITRYEAHKSSPRVASPFGLLEIQAVADGGDVRSKNFSECITLIARKQARKDFETSLRSQPHRFLSSPSYWVRFSLSASKRNRFVQLDSTDRRRTLWSCGPTPLTGFINFIARSHRCFQTGQTILRC